MPELYNFRIPIGDWSGDGHGQREWFTATAEKPIKDVREAYFKAKEKLPDICPEKFCCDYEDGGVKPEIIQKLKDAGAPCPEPDPGFSDDLELGPFEMAEIVCWYLNQGDPDLHVALLAEEVVPMLPFYGFDEKERHIDFIGYGLFV